MTKVLQVAGYFRNNKSNASASAHNRMNTASSTSSITRDMILHVGHYAFYPPA